MTESDFLTKIRPVVRFLNLVWKVYVYFLILVIILFIGLFILEIESPFPELSENMALLFFIFNVSILPVFILIAIAEYILSKKGY